MVESGLGGIMIDGGGMKVGFLLGGLNTKGIQQKGGNTRYGGYGDGADGGG